MYAPLGAKFKITTYMYKALWIETLYKAELNNKIRVRLHDHDQMAKKQEFLNKHWAQKSGLTLTFEHVTWKSIGIIYLLGVTP